MQPGHAGPYIESRITTMCSRQGGLPWEGVSEGHHSSRITSIEAILLFWDYTRASELQ